MDFITQKQKSVTSGEVERNASSVAVDVFDWMFLYANNYARFATLFPVPVVEYFTVKWFKFKLGVESDAKRCGKFDATNTLQTTYIEYRLVMGRVFDILIRVRRLNSFVGLIPQLLSEKRSHFVASKAFLFVLLCFLISKIDSDL